MYFAYLLLRIEQLERKYIGTFQQAQDN